MTSTYSPQTFAQDLYDYLTTHRVGKEQSVLDLVRKKLGRDAIETDIDLMEVLGQLEEITRTAGTHTMDYSRSEGMFIGLPYNIPFVFRAVRQKNARFRDKGRK